MRKRNELRVLLVEDEVSVCELYEKVLRESGYQVDSAHDGEEAFGLAHAGGYDLILLDVMMPKIHGIEVLEKMIAEPALKKNGPVVMLTNLGDEEMVRKAMALGALSYMDKAHLDPQQLVEKVDGVLGIRNTEA